MKQILIAEDHPIVSAGTCSVIRSFIPDAKIIEVDNFKKVLQALEKINFDLVVLDIDIPGGNNVQMIEKLKRRYPLLRILIFTSYNEELYAIPFLKAGVHGYLSKAATSKIFKQALETILYQDRIYISEAVSDASLALMIGKSQRPSHGISLLSVREREISSLFLDGKRASEIASILNLSTSAVNTYRLRIFNKLGVNSILELSRRFNILNS